MHYPGVAERGSGPTLEEGLVETCTSEGGLQEVLREGKGERRGKIGGRLALALS